MPYRVSYLEDDGIVLTEYLPPYPMEEFAPCITETLAVAAEHDSLLFMGDCRAMPNEGSPFDVYELGTMLDEMGVDGRMREALIIRLDPQALDTFDFFVTVTSNRGLKVRLFESPEDARRWLLEERAILDGTLDTTPAPAARLHGTTE